MDVVSHAVMRQRRCSCVTVKNKFHPVGSAMRWDNGEAFVIVSSTQSTQRSTDRRLTCELVTQPLVTAAGEKHKVRQRKLETVKK